MTVFADSLKSQVTPCGGRLLSYSSSMFLLDFDSNECL